MLLLLLLLLPLLARAPGLESRAAAVSRGRPLLALQLLQGLGRPALQHPLHADGLLRRLRRLGRQRPWVNRAVLPKQGKQLLHRRQRAG